MRQCVEAPAGGRGPPLNAQLADWQTRVAATAVSRFHRRPSPLQRCYATNRETVDAREPGAPKKRRCCLHSTSRHAEPLAAAADRLRPGRSGGRSAQRAHSHRDPRLTRQNRRLAADATRRHAAPLLPPQDQPAPATPRQSVRLTRQRALGQRTADGGQRRWPAQSRRR